MPVFESDHSNGLAGSQLEGFGNLSFPDDPRPTSQENGAELEELMAEGRAMTLPEAVAYALDEDPT